MIIKSLKLLPESASENLKPQISALDISKTYRTQWHNLDEIT
jgi:hypothetical protein